MQGGILGIQIPTEILGKHLNILKEYQNLSGFCQ
jgi:hypothetical protein